MPTPPRLSPLEAEQLDAETRDLLGPGARLNIFRTVAHHPKLLKRWLVFGNHVLAKSTLPARERELVILRTGCRARARVGAALLALPTVAAAKRSTLEATCA